MNELQGAREPFLLVSEFAGFLIEAIRTVFATTLTTIASFQMIRLGEHNISFVGYIIIRPWYLTFFCHDVTNTPMINNHLPLWFTSGLKSREIEFIQ